MKLLEFIRIVNKLKHIKRTGWVEREIKNPESVADHSFMVALLCMLLGNRKINREKAIKMALIHDLAEAEIGDIITKEKWPEKGIISEKEKIKLEKNAIKRISSLLDEEYRREIIELWKEFEEAKSKEARFVKDVDTAETMIQAYFYAAENFKESLKDFWKEEKINMIASKRIRNILKNIKWKELK